MMNQSSATALPAPKPTLTTALEIGRVGWKAELGLPDQERRRHALSGRSWARD
jgi:hypothetical protein